MTDAAWGALDDALARVADGAGRATRFWLRDDDAVAATPALEKLARLCEAVGMPVLLAVIPADAQPALADWLATHPTVEPCQHGWRHTNHAAPGERACELGGARPDEAVLADLARGRERLHALLDARVHPVLVPPWNRIRPSLVPRLAAAGYRALSTFGHDDASGLASLNADLDIIDWRHGRRGRTVGDLCAKLATLLDRGREDGRPIGLLAHHLAHDEAAWTFLETFLDRMERREDVVFTSAANELSLPT